MDIASSVTKMTATPVTATMDESVGSRKVILLLLLGCNYAIVAINHALPTFQGYTPHYFCQVDNVSPSIEGCVQQLNSSIGQSEPNCPQGYQFDSERNDWTVVTEWQLVCERRFLRPLLATLYFCGVTLGAVMCGLLADHYGRRPIVLICLYAQGLLGASLYFTQTLETFMGLRFIQGFFVQGLQGTTFALLVELFPPRLRTAVGVVLELYWALGLVYLAGASYYLPDWRMLQLILSVPTAATLLYVCMVPESARWLSTKGKTEEAQKVWNKFRTKKDMPSKINCIKSSAITDEVKFIGNSDRSLPPSGGTNSQQISNSDNRIQIEINDVDGNGSKADISNLEQYNQVGQVYEKKDSADDLCIHGPKEPSTTDLVNENADCPDKQDGNDINTLQKSTFLKGSDSGIEEESSSVNNGKTINIEENVDMVSNNNKIIDNDSDVAARSCRRLHEENNSLKDDISDTCKSKNVATVYVPACLCHSWMVGKGLNGTLKSNENELPSPCDISRSSSEVDGLNYKWTENEQHLIEDEDNKSSSVRKKSQNEDDCHTLEIQKDGAKYNKMCTVLVKNSTEKPSCDDRTLSEDGIVERKSNIVEELNKTIENSSDVGEISYSTMECEDEVIYKNTGNNCAILRKKPLRDTVVVSDTGPQRKRTGFLELFRNRILRKYNFIMIFVWFSVSLSYYGIMFHLPDLSGERHLNFLLGAILEVISYVLAYVVLSRFGRRLPMVSYLLISGLICVIVGAVSVVTEEDAYWIGKIQTSLALLGKAAVVSGFCTMFLYASELFPTVLRAAAMGHCGFWGRVGSLIAPQLLFLGEYTLPAVPLVIMGVLGMLAGLSVLALPETLGQQLPDTIEEVERMVTSTPKRQI